LSLVNENNFGKISCFLSKVKVSIIGAGLAVMVTTMDLADVGHDIQIFEHRPFVGGKVSSWKDPDGNHIEMGLHVFFLLRVLLKPGQVGF